MSLDSGLIEVGIVAQETRQPMLLVGPESEALFGHRPTCLRGFGAGKGTSYTRRQIH
jgi:hypothetical protein